MCDDDDNFKGFIETIMILKDVLFNKENQIKKKKDLILPKKKKKKKDKLFYIIGDGDWGLGKKLNYSFQK